jgi:hypothetical protein
MNSSSPLQRASSTALALIPFGDSKWLTRFINDCHLVWSHHAREPHKERIRPQLLAVTHDQIINRGLLDNCEGLRNGLKAEAEAP